MDGNSVSHASTSEASRPLLVALFGLTFVTGESLVSNGAIRLGQDGNPG